MAMHAFFTILYMAGWSLSVPRHYASVSLHTMYIMILKLKNVDCTFSPSRVLCIRIEPRVFDIAVGQCCTSQSTVQHAVYAYDLHVIGR